MDRVLGFLRGVFSLERFKNFLRAAFSVDRLTGLGLLAVFMVAYITNPYPIEFMRLKTFDYYQKLRPRDIPPPEKQLVTIIDLDEESLAEIGQWPWPRNTVAQLVDNLFQMGAAQVAFDIVFAEPDRMNPIDIANSLAGIDDQTRDKLRDLPGNDDEFARVIKKSRRVVLGYAGYWEKRETKAGPPVRKSISIRKRKGAREPKGLLPGFRSLVRNIPVLEKVAAGHGIFSLVPEPDGIVRRVPTLFVFEGNIFTALAVEMMRVVFQRRTILVDVDQAGVRSIGIASRRAFPPKGLKIPTDRMGRAWPYFSRHDKAKYVSARDVLAGTADPARIKGKITIVGTSAVGLLDTHATPVDAVTPGVEVHVQLIETALQGDYLQRPGYFIGAELALILFGGLLMIWLMPKIGAKWAMLLFMVLAFGATGMSWYLFVTERLLFDAGFAVVSILFLYTLMTYMGYAKEEAQRRQTRDAFSKYLSPEMVSRVAENPGELKLGGELRELTLLFCDVRGFTTISEQFDAVGLTSLINKLLTPLTNAILSRQGTVDKYMGDCIMAFWNAPMDDKDHSFNGCESALAMLAEMGPLNDRLEIEAKEEGRKQIPLKVGIGLNSGECVVGNMGSDQRFDYSVLGDTVNLAARLEGQSKSYGMNVVLGPTTNAGVEDRMATIDLDFIQVKGKTEGTYIYGLMGDAEVKASPKFVELQKKIVDAMESYRQQRFDAAAEMFKDIRVLGDEAHKPWNLEVTLDVLCDLYEERIAEYKINPPSPDWDGVFIATTK